MVKTSIIWSFVAAICVILFVHMPIISMPFFASFILAYALSPLMEILRGKFRLHTSVASFIVLSAFLVTCVFLVILLAPLISSQIAVLAGKIPTYQEYVNNSVVPYIMERLHSLDSKIAASAEEAINQSVDNIFSLFLTMINNIWSYTMATIHLIVMILLIPVLLFYFLSVLMLITYFFIDLL